MVLPLFVPVPATPVAPALDLTAGTTETTISAEGSKQHTVRSGETVYGIAQRYGVSPTALLSRNDLRSEEFIHPGQQLVVPQRAGSTARGGATPSRSGSTRTYTVRSGDTLSGIAARHDMSLDRLRSLNGLGNGFIHPGEKLRVSGTPARPAKRSTSRPAASSSYTVRAGDTLSGIASRHGMSVTRLAKLNDVSTGKHIYPGQELKVTGSTKGPTPTKENTFSGRTYADSIVAAADENRAILAGRSVPSRTETREIITRIARQHGVDPSLALAVSYLESGWDQRQVSVANAVGAMQIIPASGEWTSSLAGRDLDLLDTEDNVTAGVLLLKVLTQQASSTGDAIGGYYQGLASVEANGMYADTERYVANVKALRKRM
ncbi:LysM peptidoglycan-binding domain-containing protein [Janibacter cremeus]|uniref:LysM peptidoglycan-binding domain-containing protein n=1 Tax=Janibacter cremeus TaxID=1285192 RepID=UPI0023F72D0B|nr:LysM peptidoglycan-binding domain-containing protein [Janibacter cremeus]WEV78948.1 LysM peptidoglycan-binding domain-containing protein [Janibacter cremeus]